MNGKVARYLAVGALAASVFASAPPALASDDDVERRGACSGASDWELKLSPEDGRIEVEYEIDQNVNDQTWRVRIRQNGELIFAGRRMTRAPSGSFEVEILAANTAGTDHFRAAGADLTTDETCVGRASF